MSGGRTKDGGSIVGASVFYHEPPGKLVLFTFEKCLFISWLIIFFSITIASESKSKSEDELEALDSELKSGTRNVEEAVQEQQNLSSLVWICTSTHAISKVTVIGKHYLRFQENNFDFDFFPWNWNAICFIL